MSLKNKAAFHNGLQKATHSNCKLSIALSKPKIKSENLTKNQLYRIE